MAKRGRMEKARPAREKLTALPELPPSFENELKTAEDALHTFLAEFQQQPMRWGLALFEDLVAPYRKSYELNQRKIEDYRQNPEKHLTQSQALLVLREFKDIIISEHHSKLGQQPRGDRHSSDGQKWTSARIAATARTRGYADSSAKEQLIDELASSSGKSHSTVRRALREHGVSKRNKRKGDA